MPLQYNLNAFLGAAVLGVIGAAGMFLVEQYRQEKVRNSMARDLARLEQEMSKVKLELKQLQSQKNSERHHTRPKKSSNKLNSSKKANSVISGTTTEDYCSISNVDSSDLEFYDLSDDESAQVDNGASTFEVLLAELDKKLDSGNAEIIETVLQKLEDLCLEYPNNPELLYRIGKAHHKLADNSDDKEVIQDRVKRGLEACQSALNLASDHAEVHKWYAVLIGTQSDYLPAQQRLNNGHLFKKHVDIALSINPNDYSLHYMLGRFSYEVASLKWYERKVATAFFGEPPNATYEGACLHFLEAEKLAKFDWKENRLMIAKCKIALGQYKEAVEWLEKAENSVGTSLDEKVAKEIEDLLQKYRSYR